MIDAGTISASLILDTEPFANGISGALSSLSSLGIFSGEQGEKIGSLGELLAICGKRAGTDFVQPILSAADAVNALSGMVTGAVAGASVAVIPSAQALKNNILSPVRQTVSSGSDIMKDFGQGLINGLSSKQSGIMSKARSIANSVASTMRKALGIASPSKVMRQVGQFTAEGMIVGMQDMSKQVAQASRGLAENAVYGADVRVVSLKNEITAERPAVKTESAEMPQDMLSRKLDTLIDLLSSGRQTIQLDRRTFGTLVREYT